MVPLRLYRMSPVHWASNIKKIRTVNCITHLSDGILKCKLLIQKRISFSASLVLCGHTLMMQAKNMYKYSLTSRSKYMQVECVSTSHSRWCNRKCLALVNIAFELTCVYLNNRVQLHLNTDTSNWVKYSGHTN